jgi:hypothetical protein
MSLPNLNNKWNHTIMSTASGVCDEMNTQDIRFRYKCHIMGEEYDHTWNYKIILSTYSVDQHSSGETTLMQWFWSAANKILWLIQKLSHASCYQISVSPVYGGHLCSCTWVSTHKHTNDNRFWQPDKSAVAGHRFHYNHYIWFHNTKILASKSGYMDKLIVSANEMELNLDNTKKEGWILNWSSKSLFYFLRKSRQPHHKNSKNTPPSNIFLLHVLLLALPVKSSDSSHLIGAPTSE